MESQQLKLHYFAFGYYKNSQIYILNWWKYSKNNNPEHWEIKVNQPTNRAADLLILALEILDLYVHAFDPHDHGWNAEQKPVEQESQGNKHEVTLTLH